MTIRLASVVLAAVLCTAAALAGEALHLNPFNDPFVAATTGAPACPTPRGPAYTDTELKQEAHYRVERGTSCWLAGTCSEPNAYRYDARIAQAAVAALRAEPALAGTSIWVIAERRFITLQGCVATREQAARAEVLAREVAEVELVLPWLAVGAESVRYPQAPR
ncbi:BON domain-containing protein [Methylibium rhizosphaerae]|uniref:BON domain-containing protein n=1 Tax=Methylibium rhizosphaerae TaxID=2570323 RepID=UPI001129F61D|nr:BON domain-containing protein [Methylibium rhizosphaerae]